MALLVVECLTSMLISYQCVVMTSVSVCLGTGKTLITLEAVFAFLNSELSQGQFVSVFVANFSPPNAGKFKPLCVFSNYQLWPLAAFFPNQAALEGFLQLGLRNRIALLGGTGSPVLHFGGSPRVFWEFPNEYAKNCFLRFQLSSSCRSDAALMPL